jgi:hypothetical protein
VRSAVQRMFAQTGYSLLAQIHIARFVARLVPAEGATRQTRPILRIASGGFKGHHGTVSFLSPGTDSLGLRLVRHADQCQSMGYLRRASATSHASTLRSSHDRCLDRQTLGVNTARILTNVPRLSTSRLIHAPWVLRSDSRTGRTSTMCDLYRAALAFMPARSSKINTCCPSWTSSVPPSATVRATSAPSQSTLSLATEL